MISLIICSRKTEVNSELLDNIRQTIGVDYELILIDNSENKYSIFEAYNIGVAKASFPFLCFMHDDIIYHTNNWGVRVVKYFDIEQIGAIGIAGSPYAPFLPGSWWGSGLVNQYLLPVDSTEASVTTTDKASLSNEVVTLDGVWMCIRKSLFGQIRFDEECYKGFHFYDVDICLQINRAGYKLFSVFDILIRHYSNGTLNLNWCDNALICHNKWKAVLPLFCAPISYTQQCEAELKTLKEYSYNLIYNHYPKRRAHRIALKNLLQFRKGFFCYQTHIYFFKYCVRFVFNL
jgi:GT2 family glycosyltransferase